jgi:hypothetical protein
MTGRISCSRFAWIVPQEAAPAVPRRFWTSRATPEARPWLPRCNEDGSHMGKL